ncbi:hypothetical protein [Absidia glauca]|uniref:Ndc10 domain-containing protein n=1 Tax=Absidia glauca TaxID=4829 RepID=A0A168S784_ABSGL|nr:hypothetical protein [Absidia glauca]
MLQTEPAGQTIRTDMAGGISQSLTCVPGIGGTQFEMKIQPPRQAQEWSYSSHRESIGKALSSPGIRSNKKAHINCGSSACMTGNVCANVDQIRRQGRWNNTTMKGISHQPFERNDAINGRLPHQCPGNPIQPTVAENAFVRVIIVLRKTFIQDSVLMMDFHPCYPIWQHTIFSGPAYLSFRRDMLQIETQEHDPAHTLLQQCVPMHSRF